MWTGLLHKLQTHFWSFDAAVVLATWFSALAGAAFTYLVQHEESPKSVRGFLRFCFPSVILRHPSCRLDAMFSAATPISGSGSGSGVNLAREYMRGGVIAEACFSTLHGAVVTDSTPPAMTMSASPQRIIRAPAEIASNPLAHWASTLVALTEDGKVEASVATRAMFPPGPAALPRITWSTS